MLSLIINSLIHCNKSIATIGEKRMYFIMKLNPHSSNWLKLPKDVLQTWQDCCCTFK